MDQEGFYIINVFGRQSVEVAVGLIDKKSGLPKARAVKATQSIGEQTIPNWSTSWGILKKDKNGVLTGEIEFLPWGSQKGEQIQIRFLRNCSSISVEYQQLKKVIVTDDQAEITLKRGQNRFKHATQKGLIAMLEHHGLNRSNGSRNPENKVTRFETWKADERTNVLASEIEQRQKAEKVVLDARYKHEQIAILALFFDLNPEESGEDLFKKLINYSQNFVNFFTVMEGHAGKYKANLIEAYEIQLIDLNSEDVVTIVIGGKKDILMTDVEGDNVDERIDFITDNITEPQYYHALNRLVGELSRYKETVLQ